MINEIEIIQVDDVVIYDNDIDMAIDAACIKLDILDLKAESQRPWKAVLQLVGQSVFPDRHILKLKDNIYINNNIPTNCNSYNYDLINKLCDYYIFISNKYNKFVSTEGFSYFINIPKDTIDNWKHGESSSLRFRIWKKVQDIRLESIKDDSLDNGNVTGTIAVGNWEFSLNMPGVSRETTNKIALPAQELPKLAIENNEKS